MALANYILNTRDTTIAVNLPQIDRTAWYGGAQIWDDVLKAEKKVYRLNAANKLYPAELVLTQKVERSGKLRTEMSISTRAITQDTESNLVSFDDESTFSFVMRTPGRGLFDIARAQAMLANLYSCSFVTAPSGVMDLTVLNKWASGALEIA